MKKYLENIEVEAEDEEIAYDIALDNLERNNYNSELCTAIEDATESLAWSGAFSGATFDIEEA